MRVLVLATVFPNRRTPTLGVFVKERTRHVARHCDVRVVAPIPWFPLDRFVRGARVAGLPRRDDVDGLAVEHPRFLSVPGVLKWLDGALYAATLAPFIVRRQREFAFDVIDAHFSYPDGVAAILLGLLVRRPVTITLRGSIVRLARDPRHRIQIRWALRRAAAIVAVSESLKQVAVGLGIPAERIHVIPNGVDGDAFRPRDRVAARAACGLEAGRRVILTVAGIYEDKGQHAVVAALPSLLNRYPDLLYVMVGGSRGDGYRARLDGLIREHGLQHHVRFTGPVAHGEMPQWYSAADVSCLPSRSEGWANVLLESLACGVPVVATRVGGNPEIVGDGTDGFLVPFGDTAGLRDALDAALARRWSAEVLAARAHRHTWDTAACRVVEIFGTLADPARTARRATAVAADRPVRTER